MYVFEQTGWAQNPLQFHEKNVQNIKCCYTYKLIVPFLSLYVSCVFVHAEISHKCAKMKLLVSYQDFHYFHLPKGPFGSYFFTKHISRNSKTRVNKTPQCSQTYHKIQGQSPTQNCIVSHTCLVFF